MKQCLLNLKIKILKVTNLKYIIVLNVSHLYQNTVLKNPKSILYTYLVTLLSFGYFSKDFRLDASSDTLLIEGDPDLKYLKRSNVQKDTDLKIFLILNLYS